MKPPGKGQGAREEILGRVRTAAKRLVPRREHAPANAIFEAVVDPMQRFLAESAANFMEVMLTAGPAETAAALRQVIASLPAGEVFVQDTPELRAVAIGAIERRAVRWSSEGAPAESSQATVSRCEALVALTGSVLVSSGCGGRGASVVAPCHIVVAHENQLVPDLEAAMARARQIAFDNSYVGLITGCSRTSDIEKLLVIGAHGPRRLVVIVQHTA
jgi:L-lactate dehydrogenase complex protein LldG